MVDPYTPPKTQLGGQTYRTAPDPAETTWPKGIKFIIGNEGCERFSYYGMRAVLYLYLVALYQHLGIAEDLAKTEATTVFHLFSAAVYSLPMIGALIADRLLGKYHTILWLSLVYTAGHVVLSLTEFNEIGTYVGLGLIAVGSGGIKPCVSAHVGDQFGKGNWHFLATVYQIFYFIINFGSLFATLLIPYTRVHYGWTVAFLIPGVLMGIATVFFYAGRHVFIHVPPSPGGRLGLMDAVSGGLLFMGTIGAAFYVKFLSFPVAATTMVGLVSAGLVVFYLRQQKQADDGFLAVMFHSLVSALRGGNARAAAEGHGKTVPRLFASAARRFGDEAAEGPVAVLKILSIFVFVSVFWALFEQHSSTWVEQAGNMKLEFWGYTLTADQMPAWNPGMVMVLIALNNFVVFPALSNIGFEPTPLRRMSAGMLIASLSFVAVALIQGRIDTQGVGVVNVMWQVIPYLLLTLAEVLVSITGLEFAYSQAPRRMKSTVMGFWLLAVAMGNFLVAALSAFGDLEAVDFFWTFAGLMALAGVSFAIRAAFYTPKEYAQ